MKLALSTTWIFCICILSTICEQFSNNNVTYIDKGDLALKSDIADVVLSRKRRTLIYPKPSTLLLIFGIGTPLQLGRESVIVGVFSKIIYNLPVNSTDFTEPGVHYGRTGKSRWNIYKIVQKVMENYGFGGKECMLRAICEAAFAPFNLHYGLLGQLVQTFLTPSSTNEDYEEYEDREYHAAERLGQHLGENCHALYPECERSILDVFSNVDL
ncbi:uncharacterized protein LOC127278688 [Leptopilina boulardi]|uniref:uncharacterized protein LOC127278688 n=1 Tax=Leptopilina boulardi TaxID=63433 RepID=UPI0021F66010|nr:uncharacterized protein LOC127278688 [Leptopilina boulardi]